MHLIPRIIICSELPQWIISSDIAAYHPASNVIYLRRGRRMIVNLVHEILHHLIEVATRSVKLHRLYDIAWKF